MREVVIGWREPIVSRPGNLWDRWEFRGEPYRTLSAEENGCIVAEQLLTGEKVLVNFKEKE